MYLQKLLKMPRRMLGFRDQGVFLKWVWKCDCFKGEKFDWSQECLVGANILNQSKLISDFNCNCKCVVKNQ
jgi:hypothetical protein